MKRRFFAMLLVIVLVASSPGVKAVEQDIFCFPRFDTTIQVKGSIHDEGKTIFYTIDYINESGEYCRYYRNQDKLGKDAFLNLSGWDGTGISRYQKIGKDLAAFCGKLVLDKYGQVWEVITERVVDPGDVTTHESFKELKLIDTNVVKLDGDKYLKANGELWKYGWNGHTTGHELLHTSVIDFCSADDTFVTSDHVAHFKNWEQKDLTFENVERVFCDYYKNCTFFLTTDKKLYGIGVNDQGYVGNDGGYDRCVINIPVSGLSVGTALPIVLYPDFVMDNVVDVYSTVGYGGIEQHIYAMDTSGKVWSWGDSSVAIYAEKDENGDWNSEWSAYPKGKMYASPSEIQTGTAIDLYHVRIDASNQVWICLEEFTPEGWSAGTYQWVPVPISDGIYGVEQLPYTHTVPIYSKTGEPVSEWALPEVNQAINERLLPACLSGQDLRKNISRVDFASVAVNLYERVKGAVPVPKENPFSDTIDSNVLKACALGIVSGTSETTFTPDASITRQEAASMLARTAKLLGLEANTGEAFDDKETFAFWAIDSISCVSGLTDPTTGNKVMGGTGNNKFSPLGTYTREQALMTAVRLFHCAHKP